MNITLQRRKSEGKATIGELSVAGTRICYTLEDVVRETKIYGETAIPAGEYKVIITPSPRFKCNLPLLVDVPGFDGVRIHPGNFPADTHGCILPGTTVAPDKQAVLQSKAAYDKVNKLIQTALDKGEQVTLTITNG